MQLEAYGQVLGVIGMILMLSPPRKRAVRATELLRLCTFLLKSSTIWD